MTLRKLAGGAVLLGVVAGCLFFWPIIESWTSGSRPTSPSGIQSTVSQPSSPAATSTYPTSERRLLGCFGTGNCYYAQNGGVLYEGRELPEADATTFSVFSFPYSKDALHAYYFDSIISGADPQSFTLFDGTGYASDAHQVFYKTGVTEGADPQTFKVVSVDTRTLPPSKCGPVCGIRYDTYGTDMGGIYYGATRLVGADQASFDFVRPGCLQSRGRVYYKYSFIGTTTETDNVNTLCDRGAQELDI